MGHHSLFQPRDCRGEDCPGVSGHRQTRADPQEGPVATEKGAGPSSVGLVGWLQPSSGECQVSSLVFIVPCLHFNNVPYKNVSFLK